MPEIAYADDAAGVEAVVELPDAAVDLGAMPAAANQRRTAATVCAILAIVTVLAACFGATSGPVIKPIVPITAAVWSLADLLTAAIFLVHFHSNGKSSFVVLALTYAFCGLTTWSYLGFFPGVFSMQPPTLAQQQTALYLWITWHCVFPVGIVTSMQPSIVASRIHRRRAIIATTVVTVFVPLFLAGAATAAIVAARESLPHLIVNGQFQPLLRAAVIPLIVFLNAFGCAVLLANGRRLTTLQLWLCVAMFAAGLDALLNFFGMRYSYAWDTGKLITVFAATIVLITILCEQLGLYREQVSLTAQLRQDLIGRLRAEAALRASDERYRQIEEHTPIGLAIVALDGVLTRVNPALCDLLGYTADELLSLGGETLTHPDDIADDRTNIRRLIDGTLLIYETEKRYVHRDGHLVWAQLNASIVRDEAGAPDYIIAQIQEIGARKAAEEAIESAQRLALAATDAKSRFLATMSHEIRTPMNGIIGMTELLSLSSLDEEQTEYVRIVRDSGRSLLRVLNDILDYSKIEAGKFELELTSFNLESQIASVMSLLGPQFIAKHVELTRCIEPDVPCTLTGDPGRIRQILVNLIGNALKFTPAGGSVHIVVAAGERTNGNVPIRCSIVDTGVGIAPEVRHRLFQPFSQVDGSTTRKYGGTGLGLSICRQLIDLMGGEIGVESATGSGSTFWFALPLRLGDGITAVRDPAASEIERRATVRPRFEKLLLAEDNEVNALLAVRQLKRLGFEVTVVANGRQAVDAVQTGRFAVVFMDCHMPEMDGLEATRIIRASNGDALRRIPIVAMTANVQVEDQDACRAAGMDDYVSKPAALADLRIILERWLPNPTVPSKPVTRSYAGGG